MKSKYEFIRWLKQDFNHRQYVMDAKGKPDYIYELYTAIYNEVKKSIEESVRKEFLDDAEDQYQVGYSDGFEDGLTASRLEAETRDGN